MGKEIGPQYSKDDTNDLSGFRKKARLHQSTYRAEVLKVDYEKLGNHLTYDDAIKGLNFFDDFLVFNSVEKRYPKYSKDLYADMLRSQHIPFNFFIPFKSDLHFATNVFNQFFDNRFSAINDIHIEHAPYPRADYLNDGTSFDTYIEFVGKDNKKGVLGVEVKYTEHDYPLISGSKEEAYILNENSPYNLLTRKAQLYDTSSYEYLYDDRYRQIWRNQLLAESMIKKNKRESEFEHSLSSVLFPSGNEHYLHVVREYAEFLNPESKYKFAGIRYEELIDVAMGLTSDRKLLNWLEYLSRRYVVL